MTSILIKEDLSNIQGVATAVQVVEINGVIERIDQCDKRVLDDLTAKAKSVGIELQKEVIKTNLVVNAGRQGLIRLLGGVGSRKWIDRVQLGDCTVAGVVSKSRFPPDLSDTSLVHEIRNINGAPGATFEIDSFSEPALVTKAAPAGLPGTLTAGATSVLTDAGADFISDGITDEDQVTVFIGGEDYTLGIRQVLSATQLEVANPSQLAAAGIAYSVTTPAGQGLFSKFVSGDNFPVALFGPLTICHEAGLLFTDGSLFNRVTFAPTNPAVGLLFQPKDASGVALGVRLDWLITI